MFNLAKEFFVKDIKGDLQPVPSLFERDLLEPLQLVLRKPGFLDKIGKRKYKPSAFKIKDILEGAEPSLDIRETVLTTKFKLEKSYELKGKFGTKISKELGFNVKMEGRAKIHIDFGKVCKQSVHEPDLHRELSNSKINLDEDFVKNAISEKKVICVMLAVATLKDGGCVYGERTTDVGGDIQFKAPVNVHVVADANVQHGKISEIKLTEDTAIAYSIQELRVNEDSGKVRLVRKGNGGWDRKKSERRRFFDGPVEDDLHSPPTDVEEEDTTSTEEGKRLFAPLFGVPDEKKSQFIEWLMALLSVPTDIVFLSDLLDGEEIDQSKRLTFKTLEEDLVSPKEVWLPFLEFSGFQTEGDYLQLDKTSALLNPIKSMLAALTLLDDSIMGLLQKFDSTFADQVMHMLSPVIQGKTYDDTDITELLKDPTTKSILVELMLITEDGTLCKPKDISPSIEALYWIIYTLYGKA